MSAAAPAHVAPTAAPSLKVCPNGSVQRPSCKRRDCPVCGPRWAGDQRTLLGVGLDHYANVLSFQVEGERLVEGDLRELSAREGAVAMVQLTPPGADRLPWACTREHRNRQGRPMPHSGPRGCRLERRAARDWCETFTLRRAALRRAGNAYVRRRLCQCGHTRHAHRGDGCTCGCSCEKFRGLQPAFLVKVLEPQSRGVPHSHEVFGFSTLAELRALKLWVAWLKHQEHCGCGRTKRWHDAGGSCEQPRSPTFGWSNLRQHDFGDQTGTDRGIIPKTGAEAAAYLASYLTGRSKHKPSIRQNIVDPAMTYWAVRDAAARGNVDEPRPRRYSQQLVWLSPRLTHLPRGGTGVTMRALRMTRQMFAVFTGRYMDDHGNTTPRWWGDIALVLQTALIFRRTRRRSGKAKADPAEIAAIGRFVDDVVAKFNATPSGWEKLQLRRELYSYVRAIADPRPSLRVLEGGREPLAVAA